MSETREKVQPLTADDEQGIVDIIMLQAIAGEAANIAFAIDRWMTMPEPERAWTHDLAAKTRALLKDAFQTADAQTPPQVEFDAPKLKRFKKAYRAAVDAGADTFTFEDNEYHVGYAKYMIEYLEAALARTQ